MLTRSWTFPLFLFYNFISCTCTLEVTLHSAFFFLLSLCFKYNTISKTMPYVYFPYFWICNIFSLVLITYTFGQQRQSTDWESGARRVADVFFFLNMYGWLITWSCWRKVLVLKNPERNHHKTSVFPLLYWNKWNLIKRETRTFLCWVSSISTEKSTVVHQCLYRVICQRTRREVITSFTCNLQQMHIALNVVQSINWDIPL